MADETLLDFTSMVIEDDGTVKILDASGRVIRTFGAKAEVVAKGDFEL